MAAAMAARTEEMRLEAVARGGGMPDLARQFIVYLYRHIRERNLAEIGVMVESAFEKLSERYFKANAWPAPELAAPLVDHDHVFMILYRELYFRHIYRTAGLVSVEHRVQSWANYQSLFGVVLHGGLNILLPPGWLWDTLDEFVYQFQSFHHAYAKLATPGAVDEDEAAVLRQAGKEDVWAPLQVLLYLQALVDKSDIVNKLKVAQRTGQGDVAVLEGHRGDSNVLPVMGYYALVCLGRVHSLLGDFHSALASLAPIHLRLPGYYAAIPACHAGLLYHAGVAYMASRRYVDAIRCLNGACVAVARARVGFRGAPVKLEAMLKRAEMSYALLTCCLALVPRWEMLDEAVVTTLRSDVWANRVARLDAGDDSLFDELFSYGCPKFVTLHAEQGEPQAAYRAQLALFMEDAKARSAAASIASYLRLYTSISLEKLSVLSGEPVDTIRRHLIALRAQGMMKTAPPPSGLVDPEACATDGTFVSYDRVRFVLDGDVVRVLDNPAASTGAPRNYAQFFTSAIQALDTLAPVGAK